MSKFFEKDTIAMGIAIFSMFFGAGNVIFPIELGISSGSQLPVALLGFMITAIGGPILGLLTALRYKGNSLVFFSRWGTVVGSFLLVIALVLQGPFCVVPRCYIVAHAAIISLIPSFSAPWFFAIFGILSLLCTLKRETLLTILGYILSPLLLLSLVAIIVSAMFHGASLTLPGATVNTSEALIRGVTAGYDTMDLIAAIIFSGSIWVMLLSYHSDKKELYTIAWRASILGGILLGVIYVGLAIAASFYPAFLHNVAPEALLTTLARATLGPNLAVIANIAVVLACFTTAVSLTYGIARICHTELFAGKVSERLIIVILTAITVGFANFGFGAIQAFLHPVLFVVYPLIVILTITNLWRSYRSVDFASSTT